MGLNLYHHHPILARLQLPTPNHLFCPHAPVLLELLVGPPFTLPLPPSPPSPVLLELLVSPRLLARRLLGVGQQHRLAHQQHPQLTVKEGARVPEGGGRRMGGGGRSEGGRRKEENSSKAAGGE